MPSLSLGYVPGSGFAPLIPVVASGASWPWSGKTPGAGFGGPPLGGIQLYADSANSGAVYVSLSGGNPFSGVYGLPPASGGPTITSGKFDFLFSGGFMDGMKIAPGGAYFIPKAAVPLSGICNICIGADPTCSGGFARVFYELL